VKSHPINDTSDVTTQHPTIIADKYYVATSNAFLFKRKEFYGSSNDLLFYNLNYSFSEHFSVGISTSPLLMPILLHVKANFEVARKLYLGIDGMGGSGSWLSYKSYGGGGLIKLTYGEHKKNFTIFVGYGDVNYFEISGFRGGGGSGRVGYKGGGGVHHGGGGFGGGRRGGGNFDHIYNSVIAGAAVSMPISKKVYFVAEVFAFPEIGAYSICPAIRTAIKKNISWVFGCEGNFQANTPGNRVGIYSKPLLPYIGFSFRL
jgi:hypothetical protein